MHLAPLPWGLESDSLVCDETGYRTQERVPRKSTRWRTSNSRTPENIITFVVALLKHFCDDLEAELVVVHSKHVQPLRREGYSIPLSPGQLKEIILF